MQVLKEAFWNLYFFVFTSVNMHEKDYIDYSMYQVFWLKC